MIERSFIGFDSFGDAVYRIGTGLYAEVGEKLVLLDEEEIRGLYECENNETEEELDGEFEARLFTTDRLERELSHD